MQRQDVRYIKKTIDTRMTDDDFAFLVKTIRQLACIPMATPFDERSVDFCCEMGIPILKGREFTDRDTLHAPGVIVINQTMAHKFWPKDDPVGRAILLGGTEGPRLTASLMLKGSQESEC